MRRAVVLLIFLAACRANPPAEKWIAEADADLIGKPGAAKIEIKVDWFESCPPDDRALEALAAVARRECPGEEVVVRKGGAIPMARWKAKMGDAIDAVLDEGLGRAAQESVVRFVHILYCPANPWTDSATSFGVCRRQTKPFPHHQILIYKGTLARLAFPPLTAGALDRACLVHEFGHALGLVANPAHRFEEEGGHCTDTRCAMTKPKAKAIIDNALRAIATGEIPSDYCAACRADLESVRRRR